MREVPAGSGTEGQEWKDADHVGTGSSAPGCGAPAVRRGEEEVPLDSLSLGKLGLALWRSWRLQGTAVSISLLCATLGLSHVHDPCDSHYVEHIETLALLLYILERRNVDKLGHCQSPGSGVYTTQFGCLLPGHQADSVLRQTEEAKCDANPTMSQLQVPPAAASQTLPRVQPVCLVLWPPLSLYLQLRGTEEQNVVLPVRPLGGRQLLVHHLLCLLLRDDRGLHDALCAGTHRGGCVLRLGLDTHMHFGKCFFSKNINRFDIICTGRSCTPAWISPQTRCLTTSVILTCGTNADDIRIPSRVVPSWIYSNSLSACRTGAMTTISCWRITFD